MEAPINKRSVSTTTRRVQPPARLSRTDTADMRCSRRLRRLLGSGLLFTLLGAVGPSLGCIRTTYTSRAVEVVEGKDVTERLSYAKSFVDQQRVGWLHERIRAQFPTLSVRDVGAISLTVQLVHDVGADAAQAHVYVVVTSVGGTFSSDASVLDWAAREILRALSENTSNDSKPIGLTQPLIVS